jgi:hypothetical protein
VVELSCTITRCSTLNKEIVMNNKHHVEKSMRELTDHEVETVSGGYVLIVAIVLALSSCAPESEARH